MAAAPIDDLAAWLAVRIQVDIDPYSFFLVFPAGREDSPTGTEPNPVRWRFCHVDQRVGDRWGGYEQPPAG
jgi:hypothetical protein